MRYPFLILILALSLFSCKKEDKLGKLLTFTKSEIKLPINKNGNTIKTRFNLPNGFTRITTKPNTFQNYLQLFKLKPENTQVHLYNGELKYNQNIHAAILDISVGNRDLQQCADATMRLRAEFLFAQKQYNDIHFNFTNGFRVDYSKWRKGYRLKIKGNKVTWYKTDKNSISYKSFTQYMQWIFMYAGTLSLNKEMKSVPITNMQIGDVFIQGGNPGHAIIVVDMAKNNKNEKIFMLAQSYMPAQDIHILKNLNNINISPWYNAKNLTVLQSPEWNFSNKDLKRFD
jgi:hypothetical protein